PSGRRSTSGLWCSTPGSSLMACTSPALAANDRVRKCAHAPSPMTRQSSTPADSWNCFGLIRSVIRVLLSDVRRSRRPRRSRVGCAWIAFYFGDREAMDGAFVRSLRVRSGGPASCTIGRAWPFSSGQSPHVAWAGARVSSTTPEERDLPILEVRHHLAREQLHRAVDLVLGQAAEVHPAEDVANAHVAHGL